MEHNETQFNKLLKGQEDVGHIFGKSVNDLKYVFLQQHKYETELMKSYYFQDEHNPTIIAAKSLRALSANEKKALVNNLEDPTKDRRLYDQNTSKLIGKQKKFSTTWAKATFQKALTKCKRRSNSRFLRQILNNSSQFLQLTNFDNRVLVDFLDDNFFFETKTCRWVYNRKDIISNP